LSVLYIQNEELLYCGWSKSPTIRPSSYVKK